MAKNKDSLLQRKELQLITPQAKLPLGQHVRAMRKILNKTQTDYATWLKIAPRIVMNLEQGKGNPTLKTLEKIGKPFGYTVGFVKIDKD